MPLTFFKHILSSRLHDKPLFQKGWSPPASSYNRTSTVTTRERVQDLHRPRREHDVYLLRRRVAGQRAVNATIEIVRVVVLVLVEENVIEGARPPGIERVWRCR